MQLLRSIEYPFIFLQLLLPVVFKEVDFKSFHAHVGILLHVVVYISGIAFEVILIEPENESHAFLPRIFNLCLHVELAVPSFIEQVVLPTEVCCHVGISSTHVAIKLLAAVLSSPVPCHASWFYPTVVGCDTLWRQVLCYV